MKYVSYCRVSTTKQGMHGLGMDAQRDACELHARRTNGEIIAAYVETESGKSHTNRPQLLAAIRHCKASGATLLIAKLDRLARNVAFISSLMESGVEFVAADLPTANRLTIHILAAVAEHERVIISTRIKDALAQAKKRGTKLGGKRDKPEITPEKRAKSIAKRQASAATRNENLLPILNLIQQDGKTRSLRQIANALNISGIRTPRGGAWTATQVKRVVDSQSVPK